MKRILSLILCITICILFSACGSKAYSLNVEINEMPKNIDPQLASSETELMIVRNTFEGLMRYDKSNNLELGAAKDYSVSTDKKTYTFHLRDNLYWSNDAELTAYDFEFAIKRASLPETEAPYTDLLRNIKGVSNCLKGKSSSKNIGVKATDKTTLKFELIQPDKQFLEKLALSVFMPCNEDFFTNCKGKYGLDKSTIISNSNYYVSVWNKDNNSIKLASSSTYKGIYKTGPQFIWLNIENNDDGDTKLKRLSNENTDLTTLNFTEVEKADPEKIKIYSIYNSTYSIIFNKSTEVGTNNDLIKSLSLTTKKSDLSNNLPKNFRTTNSIIPSVCKVSNTQANKVFTHKENTQSIKEIRKLFLNSLQNFDNSEFPSFSILCEDDPVIKSVLNSVVSYWQQNLGAYIKIETLPKDELLLKVKNSDYTAAFIPLSAKSNSAYDFLSSFKSNYSQNIINFDNSSFNSLLVDKNKNSKTNLKKAENLLLTYGNIIPICEAPTNFGTSKSVSNLSFSIFNGITDFSFITK